MAGISIAESNRIQRGQTTREGQHGDLASVQQLPHYPVSNVRVPYIGISYVPCLCVTTALLPMHDPVEINEAN